MAEVLVTGVKHLVAHFSYSGSLWTTSLHCVPTSGAIGSGDAIVTDFHDFAQGICPDLGFLEEIVAYDTYQTHVGDTVFPHSPLFTNTYHDAGTFEANFNGAPLGSPLPKDVCVFVKCATSGGRAGKMFLRNMLEEPTVDSAVSGSWEFTAGSSRFSPARFTTLVNSTLADNLSGGDDFANAQWVVAHLLHLKTGDTRAAFATNITAFNAVKPVWNTAQR